MVGSDKSSAMETPQLHQRLNRIYRTMRDSSSLEQRKLFAILWDLKELALLERRQSVEVPGAWLEQLEQVASCGQEK